jgi:hypothetical protein
VVVVVAVAVVAVVAVAVAVAVVLLTRNIMLQEQSLVSLVPYEKIGCFTVLY